MLESNPTSRRASPSPRRLLHRRAATYRFGRPQAPQLARRGANEEPTAVAAVPTEVPTRTDVTVPASAWTEHTSPAFVPFAATASAADCTRPSPVQPAAAIVAPAGFDGWTAQASLTQPVLTPAQVAAWLTAIAFALGFLAGGALL